MRVHNMESSIKNAVSTALKCVVVGDDRTGKTSMIASFANGSILEEHLPTTFEAFNVCDSHDHQQGVDTITRRHVGSFTVVDSANQDDYEGQRIQSYMGCDVILVCFPVISRQVADNIRTRWLPEFDQHAPSVPILLVGTKADLRMDPETIESQGLQSIMTKGDGYSLAKNLGAQGYVECSAIERVGLRDVFNKARDVARVGYIRDISKQLSRKTNSRNRASSFFKYLLCGKPHTKGSSIR